MTTLTRRDILISSAALATALPFSASIAATLETPANTCKSLHPKLGAQLAQLCDDTSVSVAAKNHALKTTQCPHCAVSITPFGGSVGFARLAA